MATIKLHIDPNPHNCRIEIDGVPQTNIQGLSFKVNVETLAVTTLELICNVEVDGELELKTERWSHG